MRYTSITFAAVVVLIATIPPSAGEQFTAVAPCNGSDSFVLGAGEVLQTDSDLIIDVRCDIHIFGTILAKPGSSANIVLSSGRAIEIFGAVIAGSGADGGPAESVAREARGSNGTSGGWIALTTSPSAACDARMDCAQSSIRIARGSILIAGDGGGGGSARFYAPTPAEATEIQSSCICAIGGDGGSGGGVILRSSSGIVLPLGRVIPGKGGAGGEAVVEGSGGKSIGGRGGDSGIILSPLWSLPEFLLFNLNGGVHKKSG